MTVKKITGLMVDVGEEPAVISIDNELKRLQTAVEGFIEVVTLEHGVVMLLNEEGKLEELPANFLMVNVVDGDVLPIDFIHGNVLFVSTLGENFHSLDKEQMQYIKQMFSFGREYLVVKNEEQSGESI